MALAPSYGGGPAPRTQRLPQPGPGALAGLAAGVGDAGQALYAAERRDAEADERVSEAEHRAALIEADRQRDALYADRAAGLATLQSELLGEVQTLRSKAGPGAAGHEEAVAALVDEKFHAFQGSLTHPEVARNLLPDMARIAGSIKVAEQGYAIERRAEKSVTDFTSLRETLANNLFTDPSGENLKGALALAGKAIDTMALPEDAKAELRRETDRALHIRGWQGAMEKNPRLALEQLEAGVLNAYVEKNEIAAFRNSAQAAIDHLEAQARSAASAQLEEFREGARVMVEDVGRGVAVDPGSLASMAVQAKALGDEALAQDLEDAAARAGVTAKYEGSSVAELAAARREIETRNPKWREDRMLVAGWTQLGVLIERTKARADGDQLGLYISHGGGQGLPAFNLTDPAAMGRYFAAGDAAARKYGRPAQYMPEEVAAPLREQFVKGGPGDKASLIATVAAYGSARAKGLMRQIAPMHPRVIALAELASMRNRSAGQALVLQALQGLDQIKANPKLVGGAVGSGMQREVDSRYAAALSMLPGSTRQGVLEVARGLYANAAVEGNSKPEELDKDLWLKSVRQALGEAGDGTGGIGKARDGSFFVLPRGVSEGDYHEIVSRADGAAIMGAAGGDFPLWGGKPMTAGQFKRDLIPVAVEDGLYMFRNGAGFARSGRHPGQNFVLDIRALARAAGR